MLQVCHLYTVVVSLRSKISNVTLLPLPAKVTFYIFTQLSNFKRNASAEVGSYFIFKCNNIAEKFDFQGLFLRYGKFSYALWATTTSLVVRALWATVADLVLRYGPLLGIKPYSKNVY